MAIEREIPKDIRKYEAKFVGPFTTRQTVCLIPAAVLGAGLYVALGNSVPVDIKVFLVMVVATPFLLCGWVKLYGLTFDVFIKTAFVTILLAPKNRKYITENFFSEDNPDGIETEEKKREKQELQKKVKKILVKFFIFVVVVVVLALLYSFGVFNQLYDVISNLL